MLELGRLKTSEPRIVSTMALSRRSSWSDLQPPSLSPMAMEMPPHPHHSGEHATP